MLLSLDPGGNGGAALFWDDGRLSRVHRIKKTPKSRFFQRGDLQPIKNMAVGASVICIEEPFWHKPKKQSMVHHGTTLVTWGQLLQAANSGSAMKIELVTSKEWKGRMDLSSKKDASLDLARELYPDFADQMKFKACDGVAEAILIGVYYGQRYLGWNT